MSVKYILRFDDISPGMSWKNFIPLKNDLEKLNIKCLLGVIPECKDKTLSIEEYKKDFFQFIFHCKNYGDTIAQHGCHHIYDSKDPGILKINNKSEFSGHSYDEQYEKIKKGKKILEDQKVWQPYFMAPAHSFDNNTLDVLQNLGFIAITDGYGIYPYSYRNIIMVPQLISKPINIGFGFQTLCIHINKMTTNDINNLFLFITNNKEKFVSFEDVINSNNLLNNIINLPFKIISKLILSNIRRFK